MSTVEVKVSLGLGRSKDAILEDLKALGFQVNRELPRLNIVWGNVATDCLPSLSKVEGVKTVELDRPVFPS